jgi:hypothetical protein
VLVDACIAQFKLNLHASRGVRVFFWTATRSRKTLELLIFTSVVYIYIQVLRNREIIEWPYKCAKKDPRTKSKKLSGPRPSSSSLHQNRRSYRAKPAAPSPGTSPLGSEQRENAKLEQKKGGATAVQPLGPAGWREQAVDKPPENSSKTRTTVLQE